MNEFIEYEGIDGEVPKLKTAKNDGLIRLAKVGSKDNLEKRANFDELSNFKAALDYMVSDETCFPEKERLFNEINREYDAGFSSSSGQDLIIIANGEYGVESQVSPEDNLVPYIQVMGKEPLLDIQIKTVSAIGVNK